MPVSFRIPAEIKELAERRAEQTRRTLTAHIEWLILEDAKQAGLKPRTKPAAKHSEK